MKALSNLLVAGLLRAVLICAVTDLSAVTFQPGDKTVAPGKSEAVPVIVRGFTQVTTVQFSLQWDPAVLQFTGVTDFGLAGLTADNFNANNAAAGKLSFSWDDPDRAGVTRPDGAVIFALQFVAIGADGTSTSVQFPDEPTPREVTVDYAVTSFVAEPGLVEVFNQPPQADAQTVVVTEDIPKEITLTGSDAEGSALIFSVVEGPEHGSLSGTPPTLTYRPEADYHGADSFTFKANDGAKDSTIATVSLTVTAVNDEPVAHRQEVLVAEDGTTGITLTGRDAEGDPLGFSVEAGPAHGTLSGTAPDLTYTPAGNYYGPDSFTFIVNDGTLDSEQATVSITVTPVNDPPVAEADALSTAEDTPLTVPAGDLLANDSPGPDNENDQSLALTAVSNSTAGGTVTLSDGQITYRPPLNFHGADTFIYTVRDDGAPELTATGTVTVTVSPVNDEPTLDGLADLTIPENSGVQTVSLTGIGSGAADEVQTLVVTAVSSNPGLIPAPAVSYVSPEATGSLSFTPVSLANGSAVITVTVDDGGTVNAVFSREFTVTVGPVNNAPVVTVPEDQTVPEDTALPLAGVSVSDVDADDGLMQVSLTAIHGTLTLERTAGLTALAGANESANLAVEGTLEDLNLALATLSYRGETDFHGADTVTVTVDDLGNTGTGGPLSASKSIGITVTAVNDAPVFSLIDDQTTFDGTPTAPIAFTVSDAETAAVDLILSVSSSNPSLVSNPNIVLSGGGNDWQVQVRPTAGQLGSTIITLSALDPDGGRGNRTFVLTVTAVSPVIISQPEDTTATAGGEAAFRVAAGGTAPLSYQWRFNGVVIAGATSDILLLADVQPAVAGIYSVEISNVAGAVTSREASLIVYVPVMIVQQPLSQEVTLGSQAAFIVVAEGTEPLSYQWLFNGVIIPGAISPTLNLTQAQLTDAGDYSVQVGNPVGTVLSATAVL
ncbi:MAG: tandem-95 repeat protein, partial [Chloroflexi bacterium]|nr:tandem-95 repeat protein [Chloroflexota bacterium]